MGRHLAQGLSGRCPLVAIGVRDRATRDTTTDDLTMKLFRMLRLATLIVSALLLAGPAEASSIVKVYGAGATFPAPLYLRWFRDYYLAHPSVRVDYQTIGSGGGRASLIAGRLDFAGSDVPMPPEKAPEVEGGLIQMPMTAGAIVLAYNLPGIPHLRLSREAVAAIFLGKVERWNDPVIAAANPGVKLPAVGITVVARAESSGTTYGTTRYLSAISDEFRKSVGTTMTPAWPQPLQDRGALIRAHGNGGVATFTQAIPGAIGYLEYAYAHLTNMAMASLQNHDGRYVEPDRESFHAALESLKPQLDQTQIADPPGAHSYPIVSFSWLLARRHYADSAKGDALKKVLRYCLTDGQKVVDGLGYIPFSPQAAQFILQKIDAMQ
jgi:phosphate transport system substrate-binding protein